MRVIVAADILLSRADVGGQFFCSVTLKGPIMSHHSNVPPSKQFLDRFSGLIDKQTLDEMKAYQSQSLGATGEFPRGKLDESDEGEIRIAVSSNVESETVVLAFGKSIEWVGMTPQQAVEIAKCLIRHARQVTREPLTVEL